MNIFPLIAIGVATHNSNNEMIDVRYQVILNKDQELFNSLNLKIPGFEELKNMIQGSHGSKEFENSLNKILSIRDNQKIVIECM